MKLSSFASGLLALPLVILLSSPAGAADYIFRDLMANTLPPAKCAVKDEATSKATDEYTLDKFRKRFCEVQGYGWNLVSEKSGGKVVCNECEGSANQGKYQCHVEDIVVTCKRLKPGSVGLFPGKG